MNLEMSQQRVITNETRRHDPMQPRMHLVESLSKVSQNALTHDPVPGKADRRHFRIPLR
jgi:hypothetical protein